MVPENYYDVTRWPVGNPYQDIGEVINSILADIKSRQTETDINDGGKPGAAIYIPPGDYHLKTQVLIDISYLKIMGSGHGFVSSSIRFNTPADEWANLHDIWPGGSRILVDLCPQPGDEEHAGAAFYVKRSGAPRISSVAFENFCIDGLHFVDDGLGNNDPENSYTNGKTGIYIASAQDAFRITGMGFIYLEHGLTAYNSDAMAIHNNFIAECGNCIELRGAGQASKITDNLIGAGYKGYGLLHINGSNNSVIANHISETIDVQYLKPLGIKPVIIRLVSGKGNYIANNHIVATTETSAAQVQPSEEDACFAAQVSALLTTARLKELDAVAVQVEKESAQNTILDSGSDDRVLMDRAVNAFRATPVPGTM